MADIVKPLGLPQAKVNKCLIALVGKKAVDKTTVGVSDLHFAVVSLVNSLNSGCRCVHTFVTSIIFIKSSSHLNDVG